MASYRPAPQVGTSACSSLHLNRPGSSTRRIPPHTHRSTNMPRLEVRPNDSPPSRPSRTRLRRKIPAVASSFFPLPDPSSPDGSNWASVAEARYSGRGKSLAKIVEIRKSTQVRAVISISILVNGRSVTDGCVMSAPSVRFRSSTRWIMVARMRTASMIAKWLPMQMRAPPPKGK